jgi:hypothetical protein
MFLRNGSVFLIPLAAPSEVWICCRSLAGIADSNTAGSMDVSVVNVACCQVEIAVTGRSLIQSLSECDVPECIREA